MTPRGTYLAKVEADLAYAEQDLQMRKAMARLLRMAEKVMGISKHGRQVAVVAVEAELYWPDVSMAARSMGVSPSAIHAAIGRKSGLRGWTWMKARKGDERRFAPGWIHGIYGNRKGA